jgi:aminopeptidase N
MLWYSQAGTPEVVATGSYDARASIYRLDLAQAVPATPGQPDKEPMVIPLAVGLLGRDGRNLTLKEPDGAELDRAVLILTETAQSFVFREIEQAPVLSLNRGFSAPVKLRANLAPEELRFLAAHDSDPFNRWEALQTLATRLLVGNVSALRAGRPLREEPGLTQALGALLDDPELEPAFVALMLTLPGEAEIAREIGHDVDPDAIFAARSALRKRVGHTLRDPLFAAYRALAENGPYQVDAASVGRRALRNAALDLMVASGNPDAATLAATQYRDADNMTDRMAALSTISLHNAPGRADALEDFYMRYRGDPLIVDKWFSLQATIPEQATLDRVKALTSHLVFSFANPNRVRALISTFAFANQKEFNRSDGAGYEFVVDVVLALDSKNPQVAARLLSALKSWRALEPGRRGRAQAALARVAGTASLSPDVGDIAERALADQDKA